MTDDLAGLLVELQAVDYGLWEEIGNIQLKGMLETDPLNEHEIHDLIQGCIQRAIAAWDKLDGASICITPSLRDIGKEFNVEIYFRDHTRKIDSDSDSPTAAILAAYVAARKAMR